MNQIIDGKKEGHWIKYYVIGSYLKCYYKNDKLNGNSYYFNSKGKLKVESYFINGSLYRNKIEYYNHLHYRRCYIKDIDRSMYILEYFFKLKKIL